MSVLRFIFTHDHDVMRRVNSWHAPRWLRLWMFAATRGGDGWLWYAVGACVALFGGPRRVHALASAAVAVSAGIALFLILKRVCGRRRPSERHYCWASLLPPDQFAFPSGHTLTAFAVAVSLGRAYPRLSPWLLLCAVSIGVSRVLLGMHFLSDVFAGAVLGAALGFSAAHLR